MGTELGEPGCVPDAEGNRDVNPIWLDAQRVVDEKNVDFLSVLALDQDGSPDSLETCKVMGFVGACRVLCDFRTIYAKLFGVLGEHTFPGRLHPFPYDWRLNIVDTASKLDEMVRTLLAGNPQGKVDIVAHSMGGLVAKAYFRQFGENQVDHFVTLGTPHLGSEKLLYAVLFGDCDVIGELIHYVDDPEACAQVIRAIISNMPGAYQNIVSRRVNDDLFPRVFMDVDDFNHDGKQGGLAYADLIAFLQAGAGGLSANGNPNIAAWVAPHNDSYTSPQGSALSWDSWPSPGSSIKAAFIAGTGIRTFSTIGYCTPGSVSCPTWFQGAREFGGESGDETVTVQSATSGLQGRPLTGSVRIYYVPDTKHLDLVSSDSVLEQIGRFLSNDVSLAPGITSDPPHGDFPSIAVDVASPVEVHLYSADGRHVGPNPVGGTDLDVPGTRYRRYRGQTSVVIPATEPYEMRLIGNGSGPVHVITSVYQGEDVTSTTAYPEFSVVPGSVATTMLTVATHASEPLSLDLDNDGQIDQTVFPDMPTAKFKRCEYSTNAGVLKVTGKLGFNKKRTLAGRLTIKVAAGDSPKVTLSLRAAKLSRFVYDRSADTLTVEGVADGKMRGIPGWRGYILLQLSSASSAPSIDLRYTAPDGTLVQGAGAVTSGALVLQ